MNHEIDIEIPASCVGALNVCHKPYAEIPDTYTCIHDYNTANLNNYLFTQTSGTGPAYSPMCVRADHADGTPFNFIGDGKYHNYTIVWHTGDGHGNGKAVEFYIDDVYLGSWPPCVYVCMVCACGGM